MPQITLEYSSNLKGEMDFSSLFRNLHATIFATLGISMLNCKSRAVERNKFYIADGNPGHAFAHLEIKILAGRSPEELTPLGKAALELLQYFYGDTAVGLNFQPSVEIIEIPKRNYFKLSMEEIMGK